MFSSEQPRCQWKNFYQHPKALLKYCHVTCRDSPEPPARQETDATKFAELIQGELARVRGSRHVLIGAAQARNGLAIEVSGLPEVNLLQGDIPQPLQSKFDKKVGTGFMCIIYFIPENHCRFLRICITRKRKASLSHNKRLLLAARLSIFSFSA